MHVHALCEGLKDIKQMLMPRDTTSMGHGSMGAHSIPCLNGPKCEAVQTGVAWHSDCDFR